MIILTSFRPVDGVDWTSHQLHAEVTRSLRHLVEDGAGVVAVVAVLDLPDHVTTPTALHK